jgi:hypothetical protein
MSNQYSNSKIYKIWSPQTELIYIGSTTQTLCQRFTDHKKQYKIYKEGKTNYTSSFKILEYEDAKIELIEEVNCENRIQLNRREGELIRQYKDICVNICIAGRTKDEYYNENKEQIEEKKKIIYEENKEQINEKRRKYREYNKSNVLEKDRKYRKENKEYISKRTKKYYEEHKEQIIERLKISEARPYNCVCGSTIRWGDKSRHFHSQKHQSYLEDSMFHLLDL